MCHLPSAGLRSSIFWPTEERLALIAFFRFSAGLLTLQPLTSTCGFYVAFLGPHCVVKSLYFFTNSTPTYKPLQFLLCFATYLWHHNKTCPFSVNFILCHFEQGSEKLLNMNFQKRKRLSRLDSTSTFYHFGIRFFFWDHLTAHASIGEYARHEMVCTCFSR